MALNTVKTENRYAAAEVLIPAVYPRIRTAPILVVGAGGIGCELLKNLVLTGFLNIEVIDLDTIDLSNLNRQFLFQKQHVGRPKSIVARETALRFNPDASITAHHANIMSTEFGFDYFKKFELVLNALDNLEARRWVNKMCMATSIPLIESGTMGFWGQVQPIRLGSECYDCTPKPTPKTYPVCTIRSTPSQPIHCIVWGKSYLLPKLFGEDEDDDNELETAQDGSDEEITNLKAEAAAFKTIRKTLQEEGSPERVFEKIFRTDVERLLSMDSLWKERKPPIALDLKTILAQETVLLDTSSLKDQRSLSLSDNVRLFLSATQRLIDRSVRGEANIAFDKDDVDTLDFVTATSNLRSHIYSIPLKTRFEVKEMAGNIIPAIATTNAIIAGWIVLQAFTLLSKSPSPPQPSMIHILRGEQRFFGFSSLEPHKIACPVGTETYIPVYADVNKVTLRQIQDMVKKTGQLEALEFGMTEGGRVLAEPDFDDNLDRTLESLKIRYGQTIQFQDDDEQLFGISLIMCPPKIDNETLTPFSIPKVNNRPSKADPEDDDKEESSDDGSVVELIDDIILESVTAAPIDKQETGKRTGAIMSEDERAFKKTKTLGSSLL